MTLFWIGVAVFLLGVLVRFYFRFRYYKDYTRLAHTDLQKKELRSMYRPKIFWGTGLAALGCIIALISLCIK